MSTPHVQEFLHEGTNTWTYVVACPQTKKAAILDSVLDFDAPSGRTSTTHNDHVVRYVEENHFTIQWIIDTHVHADHLTGMADLKKRFPAATTAIGANVVTVIKTFGDMFEDEYGDGSQFDRLFADGDSFQVGELQCQAISTPGHTPADMTIVIGTAVFCGDSIFMPDSGTARCDFPGGSAATLWNSITKRLFALPDTYDLYVCHDYGAGGKRPVAFKTTIGEEKLKNEHVGKGAEETKFIEWRFERDQKLGMPKLLIPSIQVNLRAGNFPPPSKNGHVYLKLPVNVF